MSGITFRHKGDFSKTEKFFNSGRSGTDGLSFEAGLSQRAGALWAGGGCGSRLCNAKG